MITIQQEAEVTPDHAMTIQVPTTVRPGRHRVVVVLEEPAESQQDRDLDDFPMFREIDLKVAEISRSVIYGDDVR